MDVKHILKYLKRTRGYMLMCQCDELVSLGYIDLNFQSDKDTCKCTSGYIYTLGGICCYFLSNKGSHLAYQIPHETWG